MEKTQLKEKVQKHVDSLFLTLSQNLDVQVSEDVQNRFTNWLSQEAFDVLLAQKKQGLIDATEQMFTELQNDLGMTFREQTKSDLLEILLTEAGVSFEDNPTEINSKDVSSDKPEIHSEEKSKSETRVPSDKEVLVLGTHAEAKQNDVAENVAGGKDLKAPKTKSLKSQKTSSLKAPKAAPQKTQETELKEDKPEAQEKLSQVAETNAPQVADETVQKVDKVAPNENSGKPWTEECHDPEIIRKVNETFAQYYAKDFDKEHYSRDSILRIRSIRSIRSGKRTRTAWLGTPATRFPRGIHRLLRSPRETDPIHGNTNRNTRSTRPFHAESIVLPPFLPPTPLLALPPNLPPNLRRERID